MTSTRRNFLRLIAVTCGLIIFVACSDRPAADKTPATAESIPQQSAAVTASSQDSECPATGLWAVCSVEKRLKQSGFVAIKNDSVFPARAGISVRPAVYTLNRSRLELYFYPDAASLNREVAKVDTVAIAPVFIRAGNLAALLFTDDATQAERLSLALTAGAPGAR